VEINKGKYRVNIKMLAVGALLIAVALAAWNMFLPPGNAGEETSSIIIPEFTQVAQSGQIAFEENCAACHGINAAGTDNGPTFLHAFYKAGHHGDAAFLNAANNGVRQHHWRFGDMPPVPSVTDAELRWITKYIRELQAANGF
jgi:mono/diheme cytochrome c family protein